MFILMTGLNHRTAPIKVRERYSVSEERFVDALGFLREVTNASELMILSTCNRTEIYAVYQNAPDKDHLPEVFFERYFYNLTERQDSFFFTLKNGDAIRHLFRVASSLDSQIVGETQIQGQIKTQYLRGFEAGATGVILNQLFRKAIETGKRVRSETGIGRKAVSIPHAVVEFLRDKFGELDKKNIMIVGSGKIGELTAKYLSSSGAVNLFVVNRTLEKAQHVAASLNAVPIRFDNALNFLNPADILITSTSAPHYIIRRAQIAKIMKKRRGRPLAFIDIAIPRDIEPAVGEIMNVSLYNLDDLNDIIASRLAVRENEIKKAESIVEEELKKFLRWFVTLDIVPTMKNFRLFLQGICEREIERVFGKSEKTDKKMMEKTEYLARSITNKIAHTPTKKLRKTVESDKGMFYAEILNELFDLTTEREEKPSEE